MNLETVEYQLDGAVATIRLNRPDALNAISLQLGLDLKSGIDQAVSEGARAVVLTGSGRAFSAGQIGTLSGAQVGALNALQIAAVSKDMIAEFSATQSGLEKTGRAPMIFSSTRPG